MKEFFSASTFFVFLVLLSCSSSIKSVVDRSAIKEPYKKPLVVIPYDPNATKNFCEKLSERLAFYMKADSVQAEFLLIESQKQELSLNASNPAQEKINQTLHEKSFDLLIIFHATHYTFSNGGLVSVTYEITALDLASRKEVWKGELTSHGSFGLHGLADNTAEIINGRLVAEGVL